MSISSSQPSVEKRLTLSKNPFIATAVEFPPNVELIFESEAQTQDEMLQANQKYKEEESKRLVEMSKRKEEEETFSRIQEEALSRKKEDEEKEALARREAEALAKRKEEEEEALARRKKQEDEALTRRKEEEDEALARKKKQEEDEALTRRKEEEEEEALARRKKQEEEEEEVLDTRKKEEEEQVLDRRNEEKEEVAESVAQNKEILSATMSHQDVKTKRDADKLRCILDTAEARETRQQTQTTKTSIRKNTALVLSAFKSASIVLSSILHKDEELTASLDRLRRRPMIVKKHALIQQLPNISLTFMGTGLENFGKLFTNLQTKSNDNVFDVEFRKRVVLYNALQTMSRKAGSMYASLLQLLFLLSSKTFVVAYYAATQGCVCNSLSNLSIFDARPSIGIDASDIFKDHLGDMYRKGCIDLNLPRSFIDKLRQDCVSIYELKFLVSVFS
eukprot:evm.model.NODE_6271_length_19919_cov_71.801147.2